MRTDIYQRYLQLGDCRPPRTRNTPARCGSLHLPIMGETALESHKVQRAPFAACDLRVSYLDPTRHLTIIASTWTGVIAEELHLT